MQIFFTGFPIRSNTHKVFLRVFFLFFITSHFCLIKPIPVSAQDDGYDLWLGYEFIQDSIVRSDYLDKVTFIDFDDPSPILQTARQELIEGLSILLGPSFTLDKSGTEAPGIVIAKIPELPGHADIPQKLLDQVKNDGFLIYRSEREQRTLWLTATTDKGILYGVFHLLKKMDLGHSLDEVRIVENPQIDIRILNHWDNLDRTVERGYAGFSIWDWHQLPEFKNKRYYDYARANASLGINGTVVTNVNANSLIFREDYLEKAAALADIFRPYGIKLYLTARFSSPLELGELDTADPLDEKVQEWWKNKVEEIYTHIPDFGGFLVKANSEGQPGPQDYGRSHAEGANMLADALSSYGGIVMWRAFVYSAEEPEDRAKQAYDEFVPLDGEFSPNVLIQVKNGPLDFQPKEPVHPLFGAMQETPVMMEFQITKEYLGQGTHLVGLAPMYKEVLETETYSYGEGSLVAKLLDGTLTEYKMTGMAGVSNIGTARNWTGHLFGQADWYAFGRLAWDPSESPEAIYRDWALSTLTDDATVADEIVSILIDSYEACVNYMTPLGLHHIMAAGHHYGPGPWVENMSRADWTSVYYHRADESGIGFDRTPSGSNYLDQYHPKLAEKYANLETCPEKFLLWFHRVSWDYTLSSGNSVWEELCYRYQEGVESIKEIEKRWQSLEDHIAHEKFNQVSMHLNIQVKEAAWWRDACLSYFQSFSKMPIPDGVPKPPHDLQHYKDIQHPYAPGIRPRW